VFGGSGVFAGLEVDGVESLNAKAYSVADGPVAMDGALAIELPRPNDEGVADEATPDP
jgi:hypothetical protein